MPIQQSHSTNLASEFYLMSCLARLGYDVHLTLGNKKKMDIAVTLPDGSYFTVDVKGVAGKMDWLLGNRPVDQSRTHFYALVTYDAQFSLPGSSPRTWIIPSAAMDEALVNVAGNGKTHYVPRKRLIETGAKWAEAWHLLPSPYAD